MTFSPCLRGRISSPLEAGPSIVDGHHLPSQVNEALEYASKRLGRKASHITLLVVRRDYQLPTSPIASPTFTPGPLPMATTTSTSTPSKPSFTASSRIEALRHLVRKNNSGEGQIRERIIHVQLDQLRNGTASPAFSETSTVSASTITSSADSTFSHRIRWPGSPTAHGSVPLTPATPYTVMSSLSGTDGSSSNSRAVAQNSTQFGIKLAYAHPLSPREEKALEQALDKAAKKFKLDPNWLPQAVSPSTLGLPVDLVLKSTAQNETLFASAHLTLLSLDHLYTFRTALQAYARTKLACRLEDAVDELRRLFLANGRRALRKSALLAAYRWLDPLNDAALADVCRMYERAYGGIERESGVENDVDPTPGWPLPESKRNPGPSEQRMVNHRPNSQHTAEDMGPSRESEQKTRTPIPNLTEAVDKEILLSSADLHSDDQSELDEVEAWYREIQLQQKNNNTTVVVEIDPLSAHPPATVTPPVVEILPPPPSTPPPPPPTSATYRNRPWHQPEEPTLSEMLRTTPKLRPAPPGRSLALKLQTTFDRPAAKGRGIDSEKLQPPADKGMGEIPGVQGHEAGKNEGGKEGDDEDEDEELTARPRSAIKSFANARWTLTAGANNGDGGGGGASIDEMLLGGVKEGGEEEEGERPLSSSSSSFHEERVGPMTPKGYDDISPITRGEWGFLMFGKKKTAAVEMC
ncbi:hypothetical protein C7999DRAFT_36827 [Corynascus novoguineensis]|uniref:DUF7582 domain-containing protein n=1 Tax=Corynascus novoguineensis TaxID=1126955 RepID=A0AAN7D4H3_9PEZI|nr:hypothetical protein C7999DRAFT_36827 [Corynascus novoguineensis]